MSPDTSMLVVLLLGAAHGLNPAMGWLFAVGLGLQEQRRGAVWRALIPMAAGHALAVAAAVALATAIGMVLPPRLLKVLVAIVLLAFGVFHLVRHRHPRWGGMRVGARDLAIWSFLMATAHGAGLMVLPFVLGPGGGAAVHAGHPGAMAGGAGAGHAGHALLAGLPGNSTAGVIAALVHTVGYLLVMGGIAVVVYEKLGLRLLRHVWINVNAIWAAALVMTAILTLFL